MTEELGALLASFGADTEMHWHPGGHELGQDHVDAARL
jgi:predicted esterase